MNRFLVFCFAGLGIVSAHAAEPIKPADIPVETFAQLPRVSSLKISPDGTHVAYFYPIEGRRMLVVQKLGGGEPVVIPYRDVLDLDWFHWANDERLVFSVSFAAERIHAETLETRLLAIDRDGKNLTHIIKPARRKAVGTRVAAQELAPPQIQDDVVDWLVDDPKHILVSIDEDHDGESEIRKVNIHNGNYKNVHADRRGIQNWLLDQRGEPRLGWGYDLSGRYMSIRQPDGSWLDADRAPWWDSGHRPVGFAEDARFVYVTGPTETGVDALKLLDLGTGEITETVYAHPEVDVDLTLSDPLTGRTIGIAAVHHRVERRYFDDEYALLQRSLDAAFPDTTNSITSLTRDRRKVIFLAANDADPGTYYLWDRDAGQVSIVGERMPGLPLELLSPMQPISYQARDGLTIRGYLTLPLTEKKTGLPVVVMPHGGPHSRTVAEFGFLRHFLASRGYAVFEPNFRGSTGYGPAFRAAGQKEWGGKMQDDLTDGAQWLIEQGIADPERMCIVGWSYGGYAAAMGAIKTPDLFRCAGSINGVLDLPYLVTHDKDYIGGREWTKSVGLDGESLKSVSPYHQAEAIKIPMLIVHARDDVRVPVLQAESMARRLKDLGKEVVFETVDLGGHNMDNEQARTVILQSLGSFLAMHLGGS